ncbi:MAG TPA: hypothetical protein VEW28_00695 [Candidatus Kapabacteria bacterium]|nr:hypothetical protein [Candidatus Kapabacteria bacterium]
MEPETNDTNDNSNFEKFTDAVKRLFSLPKQEVDRIIEEEKQRGIKPSEKDTEPDEEETS